MSLSLEEKRKKILFAEWEGMCQPKQGCGMACCHFEGSPCEELRWTDRKKKVGVCNVYTSRFGDHRTVDGKLFTCHPMRGWLMHNTAPKECGYSVIKSIEGERVKEFTV